MTLYLDEKLFNEAIANLNKAMESKDILETATDEVLTSFEKKIATLEKRMEPVNDVTQPLTLAQDNIDKVLEGMKDVLTHFDLSSNITTNLKSDILQSSPDKYFEAVSELTKSVEYVKKHDNYKSAESTLRVLETILNQSVEEVTKDIQAILMVASSLLSDDSLPPVSESGKQRANYYIKELMKAGDKTWSSTYEEVRSSNIIMQLRQIQSETIQANPNSLTHAKESFERIYNRYINDIKDEYVLAQEILPENEMKEKFLAMATKPLIVIKEMEDLCKEIINKELRSNGEKIVEMASFSDFIYQANQTFKHVLGEVVEAFGGPLQEMEEYYYSFLGSTKDTLRGFNNEVKRARSRIKEIPENASVLPIASSTLTTLKQLFTSYYDAMVQLLSSDDQYKDTKDYLDFILKSLCDIILQLIKAEGKTSFAHIFLMNNYQYLVDQLNSITRVDCTLTIDQYNDKISMELEEYMKSSWSKISKILSKKPSIEYSKGKELTSESRRGIKAVFQEFLDEFNSIYDSQKKWYIPNSDLRDRVMDEIYKIVPVYKEFFNKYSKEKFSKNMIHMYLQYPPAKFEDMIDELFTEKLDI